MKLNKSKREPLPKDSKRDHALEKDSEVISIQWSAAETEQLLQRRIVHITLEMHDSFFML